MNLRVSAPLGLDFLGNGGSKNHQYHQSEPPVWRFLTRSSPKLDFKDGAGVINLRLHILEADME